MTRLAEVTRRVDRIIADYGAVILAIVNGLTAESPYVAAFFDGADAAGMQIYRELGFEAEIDPRGGTVLDILQKPLDGALRMHGLVPVDELPGYLPGTVLLYVLTMGVVVARRFEKGPADVAALREVRTARDVEVRTGLAVEGEVAKEVILQRSGSMLKTLWDRSNERIGLIMRASYGVKVGYIERDVAISAVREEATAAPPGDREWYERTVEALAAGPRSGKVACLIQGFGPLQMVWLEESSLATSAPRHWGDRDDDLLHQWIVACRDQKRALGLLEKCLDKIGGASPASAPLAELVALVRNSWQDYAAIQAQIPVVMEASLPFAMTPAGSRLRGTLLALIQGTVERERGGAVNARGGRA